MPENTINFLFNGRVFLYSLSVIPATLVVVASGVVVKGVVEVVVTSAKLKVCNISYGIRTHQTFILSFRFPSNINLIGYPL